MPKHISSRQGTLTRKVSVNGEDIERLKRRHSFGGETLVFSLSGAVTVSTSGPDTPRTDGTLHEVRCLLGTAGSSSTVVDVAVNGSSVGTVTLTSGQTNVADSFSEALTADTDIVTVAVTTAGTGAADLTVLVRVA